MKTTIKLGQSPILLIDSRNGIYIPKMLAEWIIEGSIKVKNRSEILCELAELGNPDNEFYWDSMDDLMRKAILLDIDKNEYYLTYADSDLWAIPVGMEYDDFYL